MLTVYMFLQKNVNGTFMGNGLYNVYQIVEVPKAYSWKNFICNLWSRFLVVQIKNWFMGLYPKQELIKKNNFSCINVDPKYLFGTNSENICRFSGLDDRVGFGHTDISTFWVAPKLVHTENIFCRVTTFHTGARLLLDGLKYSCITRSQPLYSQTRTVLRYSAEPQPFTSVLACYWRVQITVYMLHYMKVNHLTLKVHDSINTFNII